MRGKLLCTMMIVVVTLLQGCAAISVDPEAKAVMILTKEPDPNRCRYLGEVAGSQGNWFTGGYTSDKNLLVGARNDLRNETAAVGGNTVHIQHVNHSGRHKASGTSNTTIIGYAYDCR